MLKPQRFMREFADYQKKRIRDDRGLSCNCKTILLTRVDSIVKMYEKGFITVSETMRLLAELDYNIRMGLIDEE